MNSLNPIQSFKDWYANAEARSLARQTPIERAELLAFDAAVRKRRTRYLSIMVGLWLAGGTLAKLLLSNLGWFGALAMSAAMLMSMIVALSGAWFGPSRFKTGTKSIVLLIGVTLAGAIAGGIGANIFQAGNEISAKDTCQSGQTLRGDRISFVRHRRGPLLPGPEGFPDLADLGSLQVPDLGGDGLHRGTDRRTDVQQFGVAVPGHR